MPRHSLPPPRGFTLFETLVATILVSILASVAYSFLRTGTELHTRNAALNRSHQDLRMALDRLSDSLQMAEDIPSLINADTTAATGTAAAGVRFDRLLGEPYVLDPPRVATTRASTVMGLNVWRTCASTAPPVPEVGDALLVQGVNGAARALITGVVSDAATTPSGETHPRQLHRLTFGAALGKNIIWGQGQIITARLVRREAFVAVPAADADGRHHFRHYPAFESAPGTFNTLCDQLAPGTANSTPFKMVDPAKINGERMVQTDLRLSVRDADLWLQGRQATGFNTFMSINMRLPSRMRARVQ